MSALAPNYKRKNLSFIKGKGSYLISTDGKECRLLDFAKGTRPLVLNFGSCS